MGAAGDGVVYDRSHFRDSVPDWLVLYGFLGLCDLGFTLAAFQLGAIEANPFLNLAHGFGLFVFSKLCTTLLVVCICFRLRTRPSIIAIMGIANAVMASLLVYHIASLSAYFG